MAAAVIGGVVLLGDSDESVSKADTQRLGPADVAVVGDESITVSQYEGTAGVLASQEQGSSGRAILPDPPDYVKCVESKQKKSSTLSDEATLKKSCEKDFIEARDQIMPVLIQDVWYRLESAERGIAVTDREVRERFALLKAETFPKEADYDKFLEKTGQTEADLLTLVRNRIYEERIREKVSEKQSPTKEDIRREYQANRDAYGEPGSRDLRVVFNEERGAVEQAVAELEDGQSWAEVTRRHSQDSASREQEGRFDGVTRGQWDKAIDKAIFSASKGEIVGPIKTQFGYYAFTVAKINTANSASLADATPAIKQKLRRESAAQRYKRFRRQFVSKWRAKTACADLYWVKRYCEPKGG